MASALCNAIPYDRLKVVVFNVDNGCECNSVGRYVLGSSAARCVIFTCDVLVFASGCGYVCFLTAFSVAAVIVAVREVDCEGHSSTGCVTWCDSRRKAVIGDSPGVLRGKPWNCSAGRVGPSMRFRCRRLLQYTRWVAWCEERPKGCDR